MCTYDMIYILRNIIIIIIIISNITMLVGQLKCMHYDNTINNSKNKNNNNNTTRNVGLFATTKYTVSFKQIIACFTHPFVITFVRGMWLYGE